MFDFLETENTKCRTRSSLPPSIDAVSMLRDILKMTGWRCCNSEMGNHAYPVVEQLTDPDHWHYAIRHLYVCFLEL